MHNFGKLPPQAMDAEEAVLGALMQDASAFHQINTFITAESFYTEQNKTVYSAIASLHARNQPIDFLTVTQKLKETGKLEMVGGGYYVTSLTNKVSSSANIETHAGYVQQKFLQREMIRIATTAIDEAYNDTTDVFELYDNVGSDLLKVGSANIGKEATAIKDTILERLDAYQQPVKLGLTGVDTGFASLNRLTGGWQKQDLIILAARPGMGKTAFALNLARHASIKGDTPTAIFSLEMSKAALVDRMISAETGIFFDKFKKRDFTQQDWDLVMEIDDLLESKIFIDDSSATPIQTLRSKAIRLKQTHNIGMIIVDYLQLMKGDRETKGLREQEISSISQGLKSIAKDLDIPVIALSQLSRAVESRPGADGKRPMLSDLRESGSIEQDADQVIFLFRPEYYGITEDAEGRSLAGIAEAILAKNRQGPLDTAVLQFKGSQMKFKDLEDDFTDPTNSIPEPVNYSEPTQQHQEFTLKPSPYFDDDPPF